MLEAIINIKTAKALCALLSGAAALLAAPLAHEAQTTTVYCIGIPVAFAGLCRPG